MEENSEAEATSIEESYGFPPTLLPVKEGGDALLAEFKLNPEIPVVPEKAPGKIKVSLRDGLIFNSDFDSGNLARVDEYQDHSDSDWREFNLWLSSDCEDTEFMNGNRSWFYFSVSVPQNYVGKVLRFNIMNMNRQMKLYQQGFAPMMKTVPGRGVWDRLRTRLSYEYMDCNSMKLSFYFNITDTRKHILYFAFCYPYSYAECQKHLGKLDNRFKNEIKNNIYYCRELLCNSLEDRRIDLITVTSAEGMTEEREEQLPGLFPDKTVERCHVFKDRKVVFISSRVHPGETPSSHVFNGLLQFLLRSDDERAIEARRNFVFKLIPMLNPDGVVRGHYRTDSRGANLNRYYLDPDKTLHPSVYAAKSLVLYYHQQFLEKDSEESSSDSCFSTSQGLSLVSHESNPVSHESNPQVDTKLSLSKSPTDMVLSNAFDEVKLTHNAFSRRHALESTTTTSTPSALSSNFSQRPSIPSGDDEDEAVFYGPVISPVLQTENTENTTAELGGSEESEESSETEEDFIETTKNSGIALYVDLHAHASKRGVFIYGNHFKSFKCQTENMLIPKLVSLNSPHLDFEHCLFSEKNMYATDRKTGLSKEGSGRVGMHKATGIIPCYTLECNYNSGRQCNPVSDATKDRGKASPSFHGSQVPHRFCVADFEEVGRALVVSLLDYYQVNPWSRLPTTEYGSIIGVRLGLIQHLQTSRAKTLHGDSRSFEKEVKTQRSMFTGFAITCSLAERPVSQPPSKRPQSAKSNGTTRQSKQHPIPLDSGPNGRTSTSTGIKRVKQELKPKPASVIPPAASVGASVSNMALQKKTSKNVASEFPKAACGNFRRRSTGTTKKSSAVDRTKQTSQRPCGPMRPSVSFCHSNHPLVPAKENVPERPKEEKLKSKRDLEATNHKQRGACLPHRRMNKSDSSHCASTSDTTQQAAAVAKVASNFI